MDTDFVVQVDPDLYLIFGSHKNIHEKKGMNTDADTMYGNTSLG